MNRPGKQEHRAARRLRPQDRGRALSTVVDAFRADPQVRWWFPDDSTYDALAGLLFGTLLDTRIEGGEVWVVDDGDAVAMWEPPGGNLLGPDAVSARFAPMTAGFPADSATRLALVDEAVGARLPAEAHWYLGVLATAASRRGEGLATAVIAPILAAADRTRLPVALETSVEANVAFYRGRGFEVADEIRFPGGPAVWLLVRPPAGGLGPG